MSRHLLSFILLVSIPILSTHCQVLDEIKKFGDNPGNLKMFIHVPNCISDSTSSIPLVVALHGCSQNAKRMAEQSGWNKLADENEFIVIYPQQKYTNNISNCFNWFNVNDTEIGRGENFSIKQMIDYALLTYPIDHDSVFIYGLSAGAAMAVTVMGNYPCQINSGAIFAGGAYGLAKNAMHSMKLMSNPPDLDQKEWCEKLQTEDIKNCVPQLVVFHGTKDNVVDIRNSHELIEQWTGLHNIDTIADETINSFASNPCITRFSYRDKQNEEHVVFYEVKDTGHVFSVDPGSGKRQGGQTGIYAKDNNFFSSYYVAHDFGLIRSIND